MWMPWLEYPRPDRNYLHYLSGKRQFSPMPVNLNVYFPIQVTQSKTESVQFSSSSNEWGSGVIETRTAIIFWFRLD